MTQVSRHRTTPCFRRLSAVVLLPFLLLGGDTVRSAAPAEEPLEVRADIYIQMGKLPVWAGHSLRYTLYKRARVEARINGMSGETISIFRLGMQEPGAHTLPWDGTTHGSPFAGRYGFELYFDDDYAAKFWILVQPILPSE